MSRGAPHHLRQFHQQQQNATQKERIVCNMRVQDTHTSTWTARANTRVHCAIGIATVATNSLYAFDSVQKCGTKLYPWVVRIVVYYYT